MIQTEGAIEKSIESVAVVETSSIDVAVVEATGIETSSSSSLEVATGSVETSSSSSVGVVGSVETSTETITTETIKETFVHAEVVEESSVKVEYQGKAEVVGVAISKEAIEP